VANDFGNNKNQRNQIRDLKRQLPQQHNEITSLKEKNKLLTSGFSQIFTESDQIGGYLRVYLNQAIKWADFGLDALLADTMLTKLYTTGSWCNILF
jgi:hypothetical protein